MGQEYGKERGLPLGDSRYKYVFLKIDILFGGEGEIGFFRLFVSIILWRITFVLFNFRCSMSLCINILY